MRQFRLTLVFAVASSVIISIATIMVSRSTRDITTVAIMAGLFAGLVGVILLSDLAISRSNQRQRLREIEATRLAYLQESRQRIVTAQETLRREIAQQLHGSVQNRLISLVLKLKELQKTAPPGDLSSGLAELTTQFEELLEDEIRSISHQLYPYILRRGLIPALQSLGDRFEEAMEVDLEFDRELMQRERTNPGAIPEVVRLAGYRIAEEALTNSLKHANAGRVTVKLESMAGGWLALTVHDDGSGLQTDGNGAGMGIVGMRDYAEVMRWRLSLPGRPGRRHGSSGYPAPIRA